MANLKEIKARIASIQSTQKITSAMRMVASAKLHRTQNMTQNFLRYADELHATLDTLTAAAGITDDGDTPQTEAKRPIVIAVSSSSGLCGAFNSNIAKATMKAYASMKAEGKDIRLIPIGKKIAHEIAKDKSIDCDASYWELADKVQKESGAYSLVAALASHLQSLYDSGATDGVTVIYHHFKSMGQQVVVTRRLALKDIAAATASIATDQHPEPAIDAVQYITEPSAAELIRSLYPRMVNAELYGILLDAICSEHASRMLAMQTADDNANELLGELTLLYNKTRQQAITNELIDIMGGKAAQ